MKWKREVGREGEEKKTVFFQIIFYHFFPLSCRTGSRLSSSSSSYSSLNIISSGSHQHPFARWQLRPFSEVFISWRESWKNPTAAAAAAAAAARMKTKRFLTSLFLFYLDSRQMMRNWCRTVRSDPPASESSSSQTIGRNAGKYSTGFNWRLGFFLLFCLCVGEDGSSISFATLKSIICLGTLLRGSVKHQERIWFALSLLAS